jgi:hypothetical protein
VRHPASIQNDCPILCCHNRLDCLPVANGATGAQGFFPALSHQVSSMLALAKPPPAGVACRPYHPLVPCTESLARHRVGDSKLANGPNAPGDEQAGGGPRAADRDGSESPLPISIPATIAPHPPRHIRCFRSAPGARAR